MSPAAHVGHLRFDFVNVIKRKLLPKHTANLLACKEMPVPWKGTLVGMSFRKYGLEIEFVHAINDRTMERNVSGNVISKIWFGD